MILKLHAADEPIRPMVTLAILTPEEEIAVRLPEPANNAMTLQRPLTDSMLKIATTEPGRIARQN